MRAVGPRPRTWLLVVTSLFAFWSTLEVGVYAVLSFRDGEPFSWTKARASQEEVVAREREANDASYQAPYSHPYLGFLLTRDPKEESKRWVALNQEAFYRADSPVFARDADTVLVGVVGGSLAGAFTGRDAGPDALSRVLASDPRFAGKEVVFAKMAYPGYKQPQQLFALAYLLALGGSVDVLLNIDGFNEVALHQVENALQGVAPMYPRVWLFRQQGSVRVTELRMEIAAVHEKTQELAEVAMSSPLRWSPLYQLVWRLRNARLNQAVIEADRALRASAPLAEKAEQFDRGGPTYTFANDDEMYDELVDIWVRCSIQLDRLCRANGIRYFHFLQPNQYVAGSKPFSEEELESAYSEELPYLPGVINGYPRLMARGADLSAAGVDFLDLTDSFVGVEESIYSDACCHVNERGDHILGERIGRFLLEQWD